MGNSNGDVSERFVVKQRMIQLAAAGDDATIGTARRPGRAVAVTKLQKAVAGHVTRKSQIVSRLVRSGAFLTTNICTPAGPVRQCDCGKFLVSIRTTTVKLKIFSALLLK